MASPDISETGVPPRPRSFRDVPWRWSDVAIGLGPAILMSPIPFLAGQNPSFSLPRWLWIPVAALNLAWMLAYPSTLR